MSSVLSDTCAIILAAGKGVRMRSELPKVLHKVGGRSMLERAIRAVLDFGVPYVRVVVGYREDLIREEIETLSAKLSLPSGAIEAVLQVSQQGTGDAVKSGLAGLDSRWQSVIVLPGDIPLISGDALRPLRTSGNGRELSGQEDFGISILSAVFESPFGFGRIIRDSAGQVARIVEQKDCSREEAAVQEVNSSIYWFSRKVLDGGIPALRPNNAQKEYYLTDVIAWARENGFKVDAVKVSDPASVRGVNSQAELSDVRHVYRVQRNRALMESGVEMEDPLAVYVDEDSTVEPGCILGPGTRIEGTSVLKERVTVVGPALIKDSVIESGAEIKFSCDIDSAHVGQKCSVGPFARLRPHAVLEESVRVGNFVEVKKSSLGKGTKANHLAYIGDAVVGAGVNIGAGTIFVNYDGKNKFQTTVGDNAFVGSNSTIVAPLQIEDYGFVAAGSTITDSVPKDALAIGRGRQVVKEGWVAKRREALKNKG